MTLSELDREGIKMSDDIQMNYSELPVLAVDMAYQDTKAGMVVEDGKPTRFIDDWEVEG